MPAWNSSQPRIEALRARWERDPSSRLSLQLAEEYRRSGDLDQAMHVLRKGIQTTPSIAAEVALGRCLLENNDLAAAKVHLGRAIERDPTQMVAYRHLIEVHTRLGDYSEAGAALDIYRQLNPTDPDLDVLAARLRPGQAPVEAQDQPVERSPEGRQEGVATRASDAAGPLPPVPTPEFVGSSPSTVETATFTPLNDEEPWPSDPPWKASTPTPERREPRPATPFVSFLDRAEEEADLDSEVEAESSTSASDSTDVPASGGAPSRFGFAGAWPEADAPRQETVPFFDSEGALFHAPQDPPHEHAIVVEDGQLFALAEIERDRFELFALPSRPLRRPRRSTDEHATAVVETTPEVAPTETLSRLYREQGHEEEADQLERRAHGGTNPEVLPPPVLKAVDFAPLRQLQGVRGAARRRLVVAGYLDRLTEARHVS